MVFLRHSTQLAKYVQSKGMGEKMRFLYGKNDWADLKRGQENCYLLTNGLGGYSSMTILGSAARNDHAFFMACTKAPCHRYHMITKLGEIVQFRQREITLSAQEYVDFTKNQTGFHFLQKFCFDLFPSWTYQAEGLEITKTIVMRHGVNTIGLHYEFSNRMDEQATFVVTPEMQFIEKGKKINIDQAFEITGDKICSNGLELYYRTNASVKTYETQYIQDLYYAQDARDGRDAVGITAHNHCLVFTIEPYQEAEGWLIYSTQAIDVTMEQMFEDEAGRQKRLAKRSKITDEIGLQLVKSADQFIVDRESTKGKSIIAGYPFFTDWGRDTMISLTGCCIAAKRYEDARSIFRTFIRYCRRGLVPNMFPEDGAEPVYNTADASLLLIGAVYDYYQESKDLKFVREAFPALEDIIRWYRKGTDYHIRMDTDGLIQAGSGLEQVTWMDVRFGDILPTPRHGKPVEINAFWYNALMVMDLFSRMLGQTGREYAALAGWTKESFCSLFWNEEKGCLRDVLSGGSADDQIRCNQIWAVSLPFTMLTPKQEKMVVDKVFEKLYTPYGLRTLDMEDKDFKPEYSGSHFKRDMAYHQGTVWPFPLGEYYIAYLKVNHYSARAAAKVSDQLSVIEACMREGCIGQIAEIYDGKYPTISQGCFAQAWSVGEILKVYMVLEKLENSKQ